MIFLKIDISRIEKETGAYLDFYLEEKVSPLNFQGEKIVFLKPLSVTGKAINVGEFIVLQGTIKSVMQLHCHRCLDRFDLSFSSDFNEEFPMNTKIIDGETHEGIKDHIIDIKNTVESTILLSLPMKRLCKEHCKGLCERCGANLNKIKCNCVTEEIDPRLAVLKQLMYNENDED